MSISYVNIILLLINYTIICISQDIDENNINNTSTSSFSNTTTTEKDQENVEKTREAIKNIAYYLRSHKFNEYDRRYYRSGLNVPRTYYKQFAKPPLRSLHWEVRMNCEYSFTDCVDYLRGKIKGTALKRQDDTTIVALENKWNYMNNSNEISLADMECRRTLKVDFNIAPPFEGPLERYQWRVTASYYMCWYTMNEIVELSHLGERCDNYAFCMDMSYGPMNEDPRADDSIPFACAQYSFCPDPCCANKHLGEVEICWNDEENPCFNENPLGQRQCLINRSENTEFTDQVLNRWNVSCQCSIAGYTWNSIYGICVDIDECVDDSRGRKCTAEGESCLNLPGSFMCICQWGYYYKSGKGKCIKSDVLDKLKLHSESNRNATSNRWKQFMKSVLNLLRKSSSHKNNVNYYQLFLTILFLSNLT
ncbi:uncharacterized protein LOC143196330 [Rhynchophorus ferrugineus]|uniref:uncharacterized protein LOC143196330 n=1 Tax=Rhynchophorus ferrugineus TaxID=354439 RepID=UPI003FCED4CF